MNDKQAKPKRSLKKRLVWILCVGLGAYVLIITGCQRAVLFPRFALPDVSGDAPPKGVEKLTHAIEGGEVEAWFIAGEGASEAHPGPLVIFAHGNGEVIDLWPTILHGYTQRGVNVLLPEYRGYGRSAGKPSEQTIVHDYVAFYDAVTARPQVDASRVIFHGRSLGSGVMAQLALQRKPRAMIVESGFTSAADVARRFFVPRFLMRDPLEVSSVLAQADYPVLIVHGLKDTLIPAQHALDNHQAAGNSRLVLYENMGHNDPPPAKDYWRQIEQLMVDGGVVSTGAAVETRMPREQDFQTNPAQRNAKMTERTGVVTLKGNDVTLVGPELKVGDQAPDFKLKAIDMSFKTLADYAGKVKLISIVPSLDTPVCDTQTRKFNEEAAGLGDGVVVLTVSVDLPPAMKRWCGAAGIEQVECLSDYLDHSFGKDYGVRIKEVGLLARTIIVVDGDNVIRYIERVGEVVNEPAYDEAIAAAKAAL